MAQECEHYARRCDLRAATTILADTGKLGTNEIQGG